MRPALTALVVLVACAAPLPNDPSKARSGVPGDAAALPATDRRTQNQSALPAIVPPSIMPARYLRTLETDPAGYSVTHKNQSPSTELLLGDLLFHSPRTLGPKAQAMGLSCNSCHPNGAAHVTFFIDGLSRAPGTVNLATTFFSTAADVPPQQSDGVDSAAKSAVDIPSLRGARFTGPYGHDGRTASLSEFVRSVITAEFNGAEPSPRALAALVRYVQELDFLPNANLDAHGNLTARAGEHAHRGATLFAEPRRGMFGMSCASCHAPTTFFRDGRAHRLGTGSPPSPHALDDGFETPTLLGLAETAPYFHDGRFATIGAVVAWFDASFALGLSAEDRADLTAYVEAVGAVDRTQDDRPVARRLDETFAYVTLLSSSQAPEVWHAVTDAVTAALARPPNAVATRVADLRARLEQMRARLLRRDDRVTDEVKVLRVDLARLAADWAGVAATDR